MTRRSPFRVVALVAAFNEADVIGQVVDDLVDQGLDVWVVDHGSSDGTADVLARRMGDGLLAVERLEPVLDDEGRVRWADVLRRKEELAGEIDADWFLHHDADELRESPWPEERLVDGIRRVDALGYNAIDFRVFDFWPTTETAFRPGDDPRRAFPLWSEGGPWNRLQIKAWRQPEDGVDLVSSGGHEALFPGRRVFPIRFVTRHYPVRSAEHARRKIEAERRERFSEEERRAGWHVQYDDISPDEAIEDPRDLREWDPDAVRLRLFLEHREREMDEGDPEALALAEASRKRLVARLEATLDERNRRLEDVEATLDRRNRELAGLEGALDRASRERDAARERADGLARRLDEILASRSWRWTAPLRAVLGAFRR